MKQILLDNAYESWRSAVYNHDRIMQGFSSLQFQKAFVSSLHNAVELFLKQMMLNSNNHDVAFLRKIKDESGAQLALRYYQAADLNHFFASLSSEEFDKFNSAEFGEIIEKHRKIVGDLPKDKTLKEPLKLLQRLRNSETHFFISAVDYLAEDDFVSLHNFMVEFFQAALKNKLFPRSMLCFEDNKFHLSDADVALDFTRPIIKGFSYVNALKNNAMFAEIVKILQGENEAEYAYYGNNNYELAQCVVFHNPAFADSMDDVFTILQLMSRYELFEVCTDIEEIETEDGERYPNREDSFIFHL